MCVFCSKRYLYSKQYCESCLREFLVLFVVFVRQKVTVTGSITFADSVSGIQSLEGSKLARNPENESDVTISWHDVKVKFFLRRLVSLVKFCYWPKFHVNIITGFGIMTIFFYMGWARNPEVRNIPVWVLPNLWRVGRVMYIQFGTNFSNKMLLNAANVQGYSFYHFWVIKGSPTGAWVKISPFATQIRVKLATFRQWAKGLREAAVKHQQSCIAAFVAYPTIASSN